MILDKRCLPGAACLLLALSACGHDRGTTPTTLPSAFSVVVTTSTLASLVHSVSGDAASIHVLVPVGVSPETYEPTPRDIAQLEGASLVFENGAGLEAWLDRLISSSASRARIVVLSDAIPLADRSHATGSGNSPPAENPHFWLDPNYAELYVASIAKELASSDPSHATLYHTNARAEIDRLARLDAWTRKQITTIPPEQRAMIASHDAWRYFDRRYGIRDVGAIETSPGREPSAAELAALIALARADHVRAIFVEPEFSPRLAKQLADNAGIATVTDLYDDSLGTTPQLSDYEGMMRHDVDTIVRALSS